MLEERAQHSTSGKSGQSGTRCSFSAAHTGMSRDPEEHREEFEVKLGLFMVSYTLNERVVGASP